MHLYHPWAKAYNPKQNLVICQNILSQDEINQPNMPITSLHMTWKMDWLLCNCISPVALW